MNQQKLIELCAKARGFEDCSSVCWGYKGEYFHKDTYNPIDDANQADDLLEYVAFDEGCSWSCGYDILTDEHWCEIPTNDYGYRAVGRTQNLAKILCSLRASPEVTAEELEDAINEGESK